jgi:hypothetical protein
VCSWGDLPSTLLAGGTHTIAVTATSVAGESQTRTETFSIDGTRPKLGLATSQFYAHLPLTSLAAGTFASLVTAAVLFLLIVPRLFRMLTGARFERFEQSVMRMLAEEDRRHRTDAVHHDPRYGWLDFVTWQAKVGLWQYAMMPTLFWLLCLAFALNLAVGLWFAGIMFDQYWGFVFSWGILVRGGIAQTAEAAAFGVWLLAGMYMPVFTVLSRVALTRHVAVHQVGHDPWLKCRHRMRTPGTIILVCLWVLAATVTILAIAFTQGVTALVLSPAVLWWTAVSVFMLVAAFMHDADVWKWGMGRRHPQALRGSRSKPGPTSGRSGAASVATVAAAATAAAAAGGGARGASGAGGDGAGGAGGGAGTVTSAATATTAPNDSDSQTNQNSDAETYMYTAEDRSNRPIARAKPAPRRPMLSWQPSDSDLSASLGSPRAKPRLPPRGSERRDNGNASQGVSASSTSASTAASSASSASSNSRSAATSGSSSSSSSSAR